MIRRDGDENSADNFKARQYQSGQVLKDSPGRTFLPARPLVRRLTQRSTRFAMACGRSLSAARKACPFASKRIDPFCRVGRLSYNRAMQKSRLMLVTLCLAVVAAILPAQQFVIDLEVEVVSVDVENRKMTFEDEDGTPYVGAVDEKTKLKAKKKVFRGKLTLKDIKKGDQVKVKLNPSDSRLLEVQLLKRAEAT